MKTYIKILIITLFFFNACKEQYDNKLIVVNNSAKKIHAFIIFDTINYKIILKNSIPIISYKNGVSTFNINDDRNGVVPNFYESLPPNSKVHFSAYKSWQQCIKERSTENTVHFFIYNNDFEKYYFSEKLQLSYFIPKRYDLTIHDLEKMNWTIEYK